MIEYEIPRIKIFNIFLFNINKYLTWTAIFVVFAMKTKMNKNLCIDAKQFKMLKLRKKINTQGIIHMQF